MGVITLPCSDCVAGLNTLNAGLLKPLPNSRSPVSGLISFLNSPAPPPVRNHLSGHKVYKGLSAFVRVQSGMNGKNMEKLSLCGFRQTRVLSINAFAGFSCKTQYTMRWPLHMSLFTVQLSGWYGRHSHCTYLLSLFGSRQEKNKIKVSMKTALLRMLNGFSSSPLALGFNS